MTSLTPAQLEYLEYVIEAYYTNNNEYLDASELEKLLDLMETLGVEKIE